ncbi:transketolase [Moniliophthora roreri]|nr:transketolase [Moniliophthora roreri]
MITEQSTVEREGLMKENIQGIVVVHSSSELQPREPRSETSDNVTKRTCFLTTTATPSSTFFCSNHDCTKLRKIGLYSLFTSFGDKCMEIRMRNNEGAGPTITSAFTPWLNVVERSRSYVPSLKSHPVFF